MLRFAAFVFLTIQFAISIDVPAQTSLVDAAENQNWQNVTSLIESDSDVDQSQPDGMTALHWATFYGDVDPVSRLLAAQAKVNAVTEYQITPLAIACQAGNSTIARMLLEQGANANAKLAGGESLLMVAARTGNVEVVRNLIENGGEVDAAERRGQTALMWAAAEGHLDVVTELINSGADIKRTLKSGFSPLMFAAREGRSDVALHLIDAGVDVNTPMQPEKTNPRGARAGMSALLLAVENGHFELAIELVKRGADPNDQRSGFGPLHALTWVRKTKVGDDPAGDPPPRGSGTLNSLQFAAAVVENGADINLILKTGSGGRSVRNPKGSTPFMLASSTADIPLMKLMLELGADPTINNVDGCTPLMAAAGVGVLAVGEEPGSEPEVLEAIDLLVELGVDINLVDENGETAMHGAAYRNFPLVVHRLSDRGADSNIWDRKNKWGATPVMIASGKRPGSLKPSPETIAALNAIK